MIEALMNLNFLCHLFLLILFREKFLGNDFARVSLVVQNVSDFVTFCESSLKLIHYSFSIKILKLLNFFHNQELHLVYVFKVQAL